MSTGAHSNDRPDPVQQAETDQLCDRFESAWRAGEEPAIESFLESLKSASRRGAFARIYYASSSNCVRSAGNEPDLEDYRRRFPDLQEVVAALSDPGTPRRSIMQMQILPVAVV